MEIRSDAPRVNLSAPERHDNVFPRSYRRSALIILLMIYVFNFLDRQVVNILAESIKRDLSLSDTELGMITGLSFAIFYSLLGLPIARYAEHADRPKILAASVALWSVFTAICGFATNFVQMFLARLGVGIGEAGGVPPAHSLIVEFTPREERASALAFYSMGMPLGTLSGLALGGVVAAMFGWRAAFFVAGLPGVLFAGIAFLVLREPRRQVEQARIAQVRPSLREALSILASKPTYRWLLAGASVQSMVAYGVAAFVAPFFLRTHGADLAAFAASLGMKPIALLGIWLGIATGFFGAVGTFCAGKIADRFGRNDLRAYPAVAACGPLLTIPGYLFVFSTPSALVALGALIIPSMCHTAWYGPVHASSQGLVHPNMRATISAVTLVVINLVGLGIGPPLIGMISDHARRVLGMDDAAGLQVALVTTISLTALGVFAFWRARRTIVADTVG